MPITVHTLSIFLSFPFSPHTMVKTTSLLPSPSHRRRSARILNTSQRPTNNADDEAARSTRKRPASSMSVQQSKQMSRNVNATQTVHATKSTPLLFSLGTLVKGTLTKRPSTQIKSPYVADVSLLPTSDWQKPTIVQAHAPALDVGGMCVPGSAVYMSSRPPGGKTSHAIELVRSDAPKNKETGGQGVLVGAHPRLGEMIAREVLRRGLLKDALPLKEGLELGPVKDSTHSNTNNQAEGKGTNGTLSHGEKDSGMESETRTISLKEQVTLGDSRVDFEITIRHPDTNESHRVIFEVKNVVCADYEKGTEPIKSGPNHCVIVAHPSLENGRTNDPYQRTALFPWAKSRSQTFEGKKVCSSRALKHLRNLHSLAVGGKDVTSVVLFVLNRSDCESVRACQEACPVFKEVLDEVTKHGKVRALGVRVRWTEEGECYFDGVVPVKIG